MSALKMILMSVPAMPSRKPGGRLQSHQFHDVAFAAKRFGDPLTGGFADLFVVCADETGVFVAQQFSVKHDDRNARSHRVRNGFGEWLRFFGADDEQIHFGADKFLDLRALLERVVLRVLENDFEFGMFRGGGGDVRIHLHTPRFAQIALRHADDELLLRRSGIFIRRFAGFFAAGENGDTKCQQHHAELN
jgi:hypothetical protein